jgi:hypothetical protein
MSEERLRISSWSSGAEVRMRAVIENRRRRRRNIVEERRGTA